MFDFVLFSGIIAVLLLASIAMRYSLLSAGGIIAAILIGMTIFTFGGWNWFLILTLFFIVASFFSKFAKKQKEEVNREFMKGGIRDFWQVAANGALGALLAVLYHFYPFNTLYYAFLGVVATVTADTLATEIGTLSKKAYLLTTGKEVMRGVSGAVSPLGLLVSLLSSFIVGIGAYFLSVSLNIPSDFFRMTLITTVAGFLGALSDSFFGATIQVMHYCKKCRKETEREIHHCGTKTVYLRGNERINNDTVNLLSSAVGGAIGAVLYILL